MSIEKRAKVLFSDVREIAGSTSGANIKVAANKLVIDANSVIRQVIDAEVKKHPTALFFRAKAIAADETNSNGDYFSSEELVRAANSFVGVPFYTNHENTDITKAKGKIVHSEWDPKEKAIYVIGFIDREAYPQLCRGVEQDYMRGVSMGCVVEYSKCSICMNKAATVEEYCPHIKHLKGRKFSGTAKNVETGEVKTFKMAHVYEINYGVRFIELSGVGDPACKSCRIQGVYDNDEYLAKAASCAHGGPRIGSGRNFLSKVACVENSLRMYQDTEMYKQASQQELQQIEEVLKTLESISVNLIKNRKRVEVEFASDLVKILSELQEFSDELTGAGYGQLQGEPPAEGGPLGGEELPPPAEGAPSQGAAGAAMPVSDILGDVGGGSPAEMAGVGGGAPGTVSGSPSKPVVSTPKMPTAPKRPMASGDERLTRIAELVAMVRTALSESSDEGEDDMKRRTPGAASMERASVINALSACRQGNGTDSENVGGHGDTKKTGGTDMSDTIAKAASRTEAPSVLPEKQLDGTIVNHPRTGVEPKDTGEVQLDPKRKDSEPQTTTEDQLKGKRTDGVPSALPEKQLAGLRKEDEPTDTQQVQLEPNRTGTEQQVTTEKQLDGKKSSLWERAAMKRTKVKTAAVQAKAVLKVVAESAVRCSATPQQIKAAVASLVAGNQARIETLDKITDESGSKVGDPKAIAARARYWGGKGVTLAAASSDDMKADLIAGLRMLVASDIEISPEIVMDALDVIGDEAGSLEAISGTIDDVIAEPAEAAPVAASSIRNMVKAAILEHERTTVLAEPPKLAGPRKVGLPSGTVERAKERDSMKAALAARKPKLVIEASLKEIGTTIDEIRTNKVEAKKKIVAFVQKVQGMSDLTIERPQLDKDGKTVMTASKVKSLKIANITNVQVDSKDGTVSIAIQTEEGDTKADVSLDLDDQGKDVAGAPAEGDATGENLNDLVGGDVGGDLGAAPAPAGGAAPAAPAPEAPLPTAASKQPVKTAQFGGGGGGLPGGNNLGGGQDPGGALPAGMPAMDKGEGLQSFTGDKDEEKDEAPGVGEQMMPGSICPFCHGTDTTTGKKELPAGAFECNNCGAVYEVHVNIEVLNPENMSFEEGDGKAGVTEPELPEMPVAAVTKLDRAGLEKTASAEQKYGHVCPACGMTDCKPSEKTAAAVTYVCPTCETKTTKTVVVAHDKTPYLSVSWVLNPKKVATAGCDTCKQAAVEFAARVKVARMMAKAAAADKDPQTAFPEANCAEYISRRWGANAVATFGPCKGKQLAECVCKQLKTFGLRKRIDVEKLAGVYTQEDPMEKCVKIHRDKKYTQAQAETLCNAYRKKYAKETDENEWLEAFAGDSRFTTEELRVMKQKASAMLSPKAQAAPVNLDADLGAPIDDVVPVAEEGGEETVTVEIPAEVAKDLSSQVETQVAEKEGAPEELTPEAAPVAAPAAPAPLAASGKGEVKTAAKPTKVEDISSGVEGKLKGGTGTIGKEQPFDAKKPTVPSNESGSKIRGEKETIPEATLPDIPADSATMGDEANTLKGTPPVSTEMRGRVIAEGQGVTKEAKKPSQVEDISSGVEGKVKGGTGTIGNEQAFDAKKPSIPEAGASAKIEGEKETIPDAGLPDIPADNAFQGGEAAVQKGMPAPGNVDIRGRVIADTKRTDQLAKITAARHKKACQVAAKLLGAGRIAEADFDEVVEGLSKIEVDKIDHFADMMYRSVKVAGVPAAPTQVLATPIVQEASSYQPKLPKGPYEGLKNIFTIGNEHVHQRAMEDDRRDAQAEQE